MKVEVWVVNYRSADLLRKCITSLRDLPVDRIIILDNTVDEEETLRLEAIASTDRRIQLHFARANLGFGPGMNEIGRLSTSLPDDVVWLLNPDTEVASGDLVAAIAPIRESRYDVVSPLLVSQRAEPAVWFDGGEIDLLRGRCTHNSFGSALPLSKAAHTTEFMCGASPLMRKAVWDELGGFHPDLFLYWEDVELSLVARILGKKLGVVRALSLWHEEGGSGGETIGHSSQYYLHTASNRVRVCRAYGTSAARLVLGSGALETAKIVLRPLIKERRGRLGKACAAAAGTVLGLARPLNARAWEGTQK